MLLPTTRNTTYNAATAVKSSDLDDIQDCIVDAKRPARWTWQLPFFGQETNITHSAKSTLQANAAGAGVTSLPVIAPVNVGDRVVGIAFRCKGTGGAQTVKLELYASGNTDVGEIQVAVFNVVNPPAAWATYVLDPIAALYTIATDYGLQWQITMPLQNTLFGAVGIKTDRL